MVRDKGHLVGPCRQLGDVRPVQEWSPFSDFRRVPSAAPYRVSNGSGNQKMALSIGRLQSSGRQRTILEETRAVSQL